MVQCARAHTSTASARTCPRCTKCRRQLWRAPAAARAEAGDLIIAREQGLIGEEHVVAELGEVVLGRVPGRTDAQQVTFFKSVGIAVQDVAVAHAAYSRAHALGLGRAWSLDS